MSSPSSPQEAPAHAGGESEIRELVTNPIESCRADLPGDRINLVIPLISSGWHLSGGPATALRFLASLAPEFEFARIIVTHEAKTQLDSREWPEWVIGDGTGAPRTIVCLGDRSVPLGVSVRDYFVATFWSTATFIHRVLTHQSRLTSDPRRRFTYLIQDYEPGFYPWSARYVYARQTYLDRQGTIAVFNSRSLADYFHCRALCFPVLYVFEPLLHPRLRARRNHAEANVKERLILVYGRPSSPRNDFDLVVEVLRAWARVYPSAGQWTVISAGQQHPEVPLGGRAVLRSVGKLTLDEYADYLTRCWAGLSFMFSPHPSYPPLEMAEFGAWMVTNGFENKDLSSLAPNIISLDEVVPEAVALKLAWCCEQYQPGKTAAIANAAPVFRNDKEEFPFARHLANSWRG
jgi:WsaF, C-terminal domain/WsaF, N-terminal domain